MWKSREESRFMVAAVLLLLAAVYFWTAAAVSGMEVSAGELETYYSEKERELVAEARAFLDREGFRNSGVMLTRVVDEDGRRQYTLTVHHGKIDDMEEDDRAALLDSLGKIIFLDASCSFNKPVTGTP